MEAQYWQIAIWAGCTVQAPMKEQTNAVREATANQYELTITGIGTQRCGLFV
jgi:hypothetical protein